MKELEDEAFNDTLLAIDEFHHTSADANSNLGDVVRRVMNNSTGHIVAMTGSYFRGDGVPVLRAEDEARFFPVTYKKMFVVPLPVVDVIIQKIMDGSIVGYTYNPEQECLEKRIVKEDRECALVQVKDITYNAGIVEYHLGLILEVLNKN